MKIIVPKLQMGLSLVEMMVSLAIAMFLMAIALGIYSQEAGLYKTTGTQASVQSAENAISTLVAPVVRSAGFMGCSPLGFGYSVNNLLTAGTSPPLGTLSTSPPAASPSGIFGYDALISGVASPLAITEDAANDTSTADWSPALDSTLAATPGLVEKGSDVLVVLGPVPGSQPVTVVGLPNASSLTLGSSIPASVLASFPNNQWVAMSDCNVTAIFQITTGAANPLLYSAGSGALSNSAAVSTLYALFGTTVPTNVGTAPYSQLIPLQQTAFFVGQDNNGQSSLKRAILTPPGNTWTVSTLVPGVDNMQVLYGVSAATASSPVQQYVPASSVANWATVHSVRMGFLIDGQVGSIAMPTAGSSNSVLGTTVTMPADTRLRHVFELTVNVRNAP